MAESPGAELVLTPGAKGMRGAVKRLWNWLQKSLTHYTQQFENPANTAIHRSTTGIEIWQDTGGAVDIFVAGVGTGEQ